MRKNDDELAYDILKGLLWTIAIMVLGIVIVFPSNQKRSDSNQAEQVTPDLISPDAGIDAQGSP